MMAAIIENYNGGPVGLETLAATIGEESVTLEDVYEPYLMQLGFLTRTPRGRCVTQKAYQHLHKPIPGGAAEGPLMDQLIWFIHENFIFCLTFQQQDRYNTLCAKFQMKN